jgi:uncharacterized protein YkwD
MVGAPRRRVRGAMTARRSGRHQAVRSRGRGWAVLGVIVTGAVVATLAFATTTAAAKILLVDGPMTTTVLDCPSGGSASPAACPTAVPEANPDTQAAGPLPPASADSPATERAPSSTAAPRGSTTAARASDRTTAADTPSSAGAGSAVDQVLQQINDARAQAGLPAYTITAGLTTSADRHNSAMADGCGLSHQCPGEPPLGNRETDAGVDWSIAGENVGEGGQVSDSSDAIAHMAKELTTAMLNERPPNDGHRKNILSSQFHHIGIAVFRDRHGTVWLTQDFSN